MATNKSQMKVCECGCNQTFYPKRSDARFRSAACRKRYERRYTGQYTAMWRKCACGCDKTIEGGTRRYYSAACRQRASRRNRLEQELGSMWEPGYEPDPPTP